MISKLKKDYSLSTEKDRIFYFLMFLALFEAMLLAVVTKGESFSTILFNRNDAFMDFFNSIADCSGKAYTEYGVIYPPLIVLFYKGLSLFFTKNLASTAMKSTSIGLIIFFLFTIISILLIVACVFKYKKGTKLNKTLFTLAILTSLPMIYLLERGNVLIFVITLICIYAFEYDSPKALNRNIAYICLALAVSIKIYPVVFGLLLLRKKNNFKNIRNCVIYGVLFFFVPFLFLGGPSAVVTLIKNILTTSSTFGQKGYGHKVNLTNTFSFIGELVGNKTTFNTIGNAVVVITAILIISLLIFGKYESKWKYIAIATLFIILIPGFSYIYSLCYMIVPLIMFLNETGKNGKITKKLDYIYLILFVAQFALFTLKDSNMFEQFEKYELNLTFATVVESIDLLIMLVILLTEGVIKTYKAYEDTLIPKIKVKGNAAVAMALVLTVICGSAFSYVYTPTQSGTSITNFECFDVDKTKSSNIKSLEKLNNFIDKNMKDKKVVMFPKLSYFDEVKNVASDAVYYDISNYDNSISDINKINDLGANYIIIYNANSTDIGETGKSVSFTQLQEYMDMYRSILSTTWDYNYKIVDNIEVVDSTKYQRSYTISIYEKTDDIENITWASAGTGIQEDPYLVSTAEELNNFSRYVNSGHSGLDTYVKLNNDIDMSEIDDFSPIGSEKLDFVCSVNFDGDGHKIKNLKIDGKENKITGLLDDIGLFGYFNGTISNLIVENCHFKGNCVGIFVRYALSGTIINCIAQNNNVVSNRTGEIADDFQGSIVSCLSLNNNSNDGDTSKKCALIGNVSSTTKIKNCFSNIKNTSNDTVIDDNILKSNDFINLLNNTSNDYVKTNKLTLTLNQYEYEKIFTMKSKSAI